MQTTTFVREQWICWLHAAIQDKNNHYYKVESIYYTRFKCVYVHLFEWANHKRRPFHLQPNVRPIIISTTTWWKRVFISTSFQIFPYRSADEEKRKWAKKSLASRETLSFRSEFEIMLWDLFMDPSDTSDSYERCWFFFVLVFTIPVRSLSNSCQWIPFFSSVQPIVDEQYQHCRNKVNPESTHIRTSTNNFAYSNWSLE